MKSEKKHAAIIGAGIAGLSAASYLLRNGYRVILLFGIPVIGKGALKDLPQQKLPSVGIYRRLWLV